MRGFTSNEVQTSKKDSKSSWSSLDNVTVTSLDITCVTLFLVCIHDVINEIV